MKMNRIEETAAERMPRPLPEKWANKFDLELALPGHGPQEPAEKPGADRDGDWVVCLCLHGLN